MTIKELKHEIDKSIVWLESDFQDTLDRHKTIETLYTTSVDSLKPKLKAVFQALCLLPSGFSFLCANFANGLTRKDIHTLERSGLIRRDELLGYSIHELIRQYGAFQLEKEGKIDAAMENLKNYYLNWFKELQDLASSNIKMKDVDLLHKETDNIEIIKQWLYDNEKFDELRHFWLINQSTHLTEDLRRLTGLLPYYKSSLPIESYHHLLYKITEYCYATNSYQLGMLPYFEEYLAVAKQRNHKGYLGFAHFELSRFYSEYQGIESETSLQELDIAKEYLYRFADDFATNRNPHPSGHEAQLIEVAARCAIWTEDTEASWKYNDQFTHLAKFCANELHQTTANWGMAIANIFGENPTNSLYYMNKCTTAWLHNGLILTMGLRLPTYAQIAELFEDYEEAAKFFGRGHSIVEAMCRKPVAPLSFCDSKSMANVEIAIGKKRYDELCVQGKKESFQEIIDSVDRFTQRYGGFV
jgi:hypothetical protein